MFSKFVLLVSLGLICSTVCFAADGGNSGGGGDMCEDRIQEIRNDIREWINRGGHTRLTLSGGTSYESYASQMLEQIGKASISCVGRGDKGYPVFVKDARTGAKVPKVCRFDRTSRESKITCDYDKFLAMKEDEEGQYRLVHHEYAGLAGLELPDGADSHYEISNQITAFLQNQVIKRLNVVSIEPEVEAPNGNSRLSKLDNGFYNPSSRLDNDDSFHTEVDVENSKLILTKVWVTSTYGRIRYHPAAYPYDVTVVMVCSNNICKSEGEVWYGDRAQSTLGTVTISILPDGNFTMESKFNLETTLWTGANPLIRKFMRVKDASWVR